MYDALSITGVTNMNRFAGYTDKYNNTKSQIVKRYPLHNLITFL